MSRGLSTVDGPLFVGHKARIGTVFLANDSPENLFWGSLCLKFLIREHALENSMKMRQIVLSVSALFASTAIVLAGGESCGTKATSASAKSGSCCSMKASNVKKASMDKCSMDAKSSKECSTEKAESCSMTSSKKSGSCCSMKAKDVKSTSTQPKVEVGVVTPDQSGK